MVAPPPCQSTVQWKRPQRGMSGRKFITTPFATSMPANAAASRPNKRKAYTPKKRVGVKRRRKTVRSNAPSPKKWMRMAIIPPSLKGRLMKTQITRTLSMVEWDYAAASTDIQYKGIYKAINPKTDVDATLNGFDSSLCDYYHVNWIKIIVQANDRAGSRFSDVMEGIAYYDPDGVGTPNPNSWGDREYNKMYNNKTMIVRGERLSDKGISIFVRDPWLLTPYFQQQNQEVPFARLEPQGLINNAVQVTFPGFCFMFKKPLVNFGGTTPMFGYADSYYTYTIRKIVNITYFGVNL